MNIRLPFKLIAVDFEGTGSDRHKYDITEVGAVFLDQNLKEQGRFHSLIKPMGDARSAEAMAVHGVPEEELQAAPSFGDVMAELTLACPFNPKHYVPAAWGIHWDLPFWQDQVLKDEGGWPWGMRSFDIKTAVVMEMAKNGIEFRGGVSKSLEICRMKFEGREHNALDDIVNTLRVFRYCANGVPSKFNG